jgi:tetratricopeptide (TPR) repeat protein
MRRFLNWRYLLAGFCLLVVLTVVWVEVAISRLDRMTAAGDAYTEGEVDIGRADYPRAIAAFDQALELGYERSTVLASRGFARCRMGQFDEGIAEIDQAIALAPGEPFSLHQKARANFEHGSFADAVGYIDAAIACLPGRRGTREDRLLALRAQSLFRLGKHREALDDINRAIRLGGVNPHYKAVREQIERALPIEGAPA